MLNHKAVSSQYNNDGSAVKTPTPAEWFSNYKPEGVVPRATIQGCEPIAWVDEQWDKDRYVVEPLIMDVVRAVDNKAKVDLERSTRCPINKHAREVLHGTRSRVIIGQHYHCSGNVVYVAPTGCSAYSDRRGCRSGIANFSLGSAKRMRKYLRSCVAEYKTMLTLTYPQNFTTDGKESKEHLRRFVQELKRKVARDNFGVIPEGYSCFWFLEFQERGAPHYHLLLTTAVDKKWVAETWFRIVDSGDRKHLSAGTRAEWLRAGRRGTMAYAIKYANKNSQKVVPENFKNVGRFWGVSGNPGVKAADYTLNEENLKVADVKAAVDLFEKVMKLGVAAGEIELKTDKNGCRVWFTKNDATSGVIRILINKIGEAARRHLGERLQGDFDGF